MNQKALKRLVNTFLFLGVLSWIVFFIAMSFYKYDFYERIDIVDQQGYTPFSLKHAFSLTVFLLLGYWSLYKVSTKGRHLPPLQIVMFITFIIVAIILSIFMIIQLCYMYDPQDFSEPMVALLLLPAPIFYFALCIVVLQKFVSQERVIAEDRAYANRWLNALNSKLVKSGDFSIWTIIVVFPILLIITLILILFGQDADSLVKVFTETTTWTFSQKTHPPYLEHRWHYLCTVAACGSPKIVKPQRLGARHGTEIIVNRQLMIANAFEELIQDTSPKFHRWIRSNYDKYGYPLSKKINSKWRSNFTYILMKPLEWMFLLVLYSFSAQPEAKIKRQYA